MANHIDLKDSGLKATLPRIKVLDIFEQSKDKHMSAEDVYKQILESSEDVGLATIYRVLTQFEQADILVRHHFETGKAVFELNEKTHHDHIVCIQCGHVEEFCNNAEKIYYGKLSQKKIGLNARKLVEKNHNLKKISKKLVSFLETVT